MEKVSDVSIEDVQGAGQLVESNTALEASHAKCILDLSFTKFKWNLNEDFTRFHRPNLQLNFDMERFIIKSLRD
jgi:hypothetical protein